MSNNEASSSKHIGEESTHESDVDMDSETEETIGFGWCGILEKDEVSRSSGSND